jgi:hypothetical protein
MKIDAKLQAPADAAPAAPAPAAEKPKTKQAAKPNKPVKAAKAAKPEKQKKAAKPAGLRSHLYKELRGTPLNLCNCRRADFTEQTIVKERLAGASLSVVCVTGTYGVSLSLLPVKGTLADLGDGRVFDLAGLKHCKVWSPKQAASELAKTREVKVAIGRRKVEAKGRLLGDLSQMYVGFADGKLFTTLQTKSLGDRNADSTFALLK